MIDWIKTAHGLAAIVAVIFPTMVSWWNLGLPRLVFSPEAPMHARIEALERLNRDTRLLVPAQAWWPAIRSGCSGRRWNAAFVASAPTAQCSSQIRVPQRQPRKPDRSRLCDFGGGARPALGKD